MDNLKDKVETALNKIRPALVADGGNVELVDVKDGVCQGKAGRTLRRLPHVADDPQERHRAHAKTGDTGGQAGRFRLT